MGKLRHSLPMESLFQWLQNPVPGKAGAQVPSLKLSSLAPHPQCSVRAAVVGDNPMNIL